MTRPGSPIGEDDLQAFIDDQLSAERREAVEAYLAEQPEIAARLAAERAQRQALRERLQGKAEEPVPPRLRIAAIRAARQSRNGQQLRTAAAALLIFALGGGGGWFAAREAPAATARANAAIGVAEDAAGAYRVYTVEVTHPVEVGAGEEAHLMRWLSKRLGRALAAPDLGRFGYRLMGGRLLPANARAAAQLMYEDAAGKRLTLYIQGTDGNETAFRFDEQHDASTCAWIDQGFGFAVTAAASRAEILPIAEAVYQSFEGLPPSHSG